MMHKCLRGVVACLLAMLCTTAAGAGQGGGSLAFVNVNVITMEDEHVHAGQTVLVRGDRIVAVGARETVAVADDAMRVDGAGRYLLPGLTDAHVHLTSSPWAPTRPDFGDAPLYLAHGVTTVINLRGTPVQLDWKHRVERGELLGPAIYTSGEFVNEPRVTTPDEVEQDVRAQASGGYDLIKFHEIWTPETGYVTTTGLSRPAYLRMIETARELEIPVVGHAPVNLGIDALLEARQPLAHVGLLASAYFRPVLSQSRFLLIVATTLVGLALAVLVWSSGAIVSRFRRRDRAPAGELGRLRALASAVLAATMLALVCALLFLPGGPLFDGDLLRLAFSLLAVIIGSMAAVLIVRASRVLRTGSPRARVEVLLLMTAAIVLATWAVTWTPIAWRSSSRGIQSLAARLQAAGVSVQSTLVVYEAGAPGGAEKLMQDPVIAHLSVPTRDVWSRMQGRPGEPMPASYLRSMQKVVGALHAAGVPIVAGTDAMGVPFLAPGASLHRELELLVASGLTRYQAIRSATVNPAMFLRKSQDFGTIGVGRRADLLLVDVNPLEDLAALRRPVGVMAGGRWLPREQLDGLLGALAR